MRCRAEFLTGRRFEALFVAPPSQSHRDLEPCGWRSNPLSAETTVGERRMNLQLRGGTGTSESKCLRSLNVRDGIAPTVMRILGIYAKTCKSGKDGVERLPEIGLGPIAEEISAFGKSDSNGSCGKLLVYKRNTPAKFLKMTPKTDPFCQCLQGAITEFSQTRLGDGLFDYVA